MEYESNKYGKCVLADLTQKALEDFHRAMKGKEKEPLSVWRGDSVRALIELGVMVEPKWTVEDVDNANPGHIIWLSDRIADLFTEAMQIDPLP
jgi:hypothetical protein